MKSKNQKLTEILFAIYLVALVWIIVFKMQFSFSDMDFIRSVNLEPYAAPTRIGGEIVYEEIYFNVLAFIPFGIYAEILFKKWNAFQKILLFFFVSVLFEGVQYIFALGVSDITDVINNVAGGIIGLLLYKGVERLMSNRHQTHKYVNIVAAAGTFIVLVILFLLKIT